MIKSIHFIILNKLMTLLQTAKVSFIESKKLMLKRWTFDIPKLSSIFKNEYVYYVHMCKCI